MLVKIRSMQLGFSGFLKHLGSENIFVAAPVNTASSLNFGFYFKVTSATKQLVKMCHLRHRLRIFLFCGKVMFRSQYIEVFVFSNIPWCFCIFNHRLIYQIWDMMNIRTWDMAHFWISQSIDINKGNNFH